jgi:hypothetical protein
MEARSVPNSRIARFWRAWRREILRGAMMFAGVVGIGFVAMHFFRTFASGWGDFGDFANAFGNREQHDWQEAFFYSDRLGPGQTVWIRNRSGEVHIEAAEGESLMVMAEKSWRHSGPESVEIMAVPHEGGVTICALWEGASSKCEPEGEYENTQPRQSDVNVKFMVHVPRGVAVDASTVNGQLEVIDVEAPVITQTVNGTIHAHVLQAPFSATTVNGQIDADFLFRGGKIGGEIALVTVNGSIDAGLPPGLNANIEAKTVNGKVETEFPVAITGRLTSKQVIGRLGSGGPPLRISAVNGSIHLTESDLEPEMHPAAHPHAPDGEVTPVPATPAVPPVPATPAVPKSPKSRSRVTP